MSRSGYSDDCDGWDLIRWRGAVASSIRGKRGQAFLRELITALDALPQKELIFAELEHEGQVCALGSVGKMRGLDMSTIEPEVREDVAKAFGIPIALACEIMYENDEWRHEPPSQRWLRLYVWAEEHLKTIQGEPI